MPRTLNLDAHQPDDIVITFGGVEYEMPGAIPVPSIVRMMRLQQRAEAATKGKRADELADLLEALLESPDPAAPGILDLIRQRNPDVGQLPLTINGVLSIIEFLIAELGVEEAARSASDEPDVGEEEEARPLAQAS